MKKILEYLIKPRFSLLFIVCWILASAFLDVAISLSWELYENETVKTYHEGRTK